MRRGSRAGTGRLSALLPLITITTFLVAAFVGCSTAPESADDEAWVGSISTEGSVTTVVNEAGSVWGGAARLVEEASIGVEAGADEYMFGHISGLWASEDRIFVVDGQVPAVRVYDFDGVFVRNIGGAGQGPGEYTSPGAIVGTADGRLYLMDDHNNKIHVFGIDGDYRETWPAQNVPYWPPAIAADGALWLPLTVQTGPGRDDFRRAIQAHGPEGPYGPRYLLKDIDFEPTTVRVGERDREIVPFAPSLSWAPAGAASFVVGAGDRYRFEIQHAGETVLVVEKYWSPIPVDPAYQEWARQLTVAEWQGSVPGWTWNGAEIPDYLPAFSGLYPMPSGQIWVVRRAASARQAECVDAPLASGAAAARQAPCWIVQWAPPDVFDTDGGYLGNVDVPPEVRLSFFSFFAQDGIVLDAILDEQGTPMVKRFRLVLPGEQ